MSKSSETQQALSIDSYLQILQAFRWKQETKGGSDSGQADHHDNRRSRGRWIVDFVESYMYVDSNVWTIWLTIPALLPNKKKI